MKKILSVDDNLAALTMLREILRDEYKVYAVTSGKEALHFLDKEAPDLILMDYYMNGMDGLETMALMRQREETPIPVVMLTSISSQALEKQARTLGAAAFLPKPIEPEYLKETIRRVLSPERGAPDC